jgi:SAM-dependent methyltransferase
VEDAHVAPDGSPVEAYALLPELGEGELIARVVRSGGSILELGCGTGRMTRQLVRPGYRVTTVDESAEMLARVEDAETVCSRIEGLDLARHFDAVVLASNLIAAPPEQRCAFLATCLRHADLLVVEGLPLGWRPEEGETRLGPVLSRLLTDDVQNGVVRGVATYEASGRVWTHAFAMWVFADEEELDAALAEAGFLRERWLDREGGRWFTARSVSEPITGV